MSASGIIERLAWQPTIFAERLNRFELLRLRAILPSDGPRLRIHRNHAVEGVVSALPPFLAFAGLWLTPLIGEYDDRLAVPRDGPVACELVWLDFDRYDRLSEDELLSWLVERLSSLRLASDAPIVVANAPGQSLRERAVNAALERWTAVTPSVAILDLASLATELGEGFLDETRARLTGSRLSNAAALATARKLGLEILPELMTTPIKALALDLDNTLYAGVLGEDGAEGIRLTESHARLQATLVEWARRGLLLAVVSRNEPADVEALFATRQDFPLTAEHIASWQVGWGEKSASIAAAAEAFNIGPDTILFLDDNIGELAEAAERLPGLRLLYAGGMETAEALARFPALPRRGGAFAGRAEDLRANVARDDLARQARSEADYLRALGATLTFTLDPPEDRQRLAEISGKTNQFNLALRRLSEMEVQRRLRSPDARLVHVRLADRLADSGSVAALFVRREGELAVVDELCISCRALGRHLEDLMIREAVHRAAAELGCDQVAFEYAEGPRNLPARRWLEAFLGHPLEAATGRTAPMDVPSSAAGGAVTVSWTN